MQSGRRVRWKRLSWAISRPAEASPLASQQPGPEKDAAVHDDELTAAIRQVQERARARVPQGPMGLDGVAAPDLMPLVHARDAAEAKVAAIGTVNPRRGGVVNALVQRVKRMVARGLDWHVREQVEFNRASM